MHAWKRRIIGATETLVLLGLFILPFSKSAAEIGFILALVFWLILKIFFREAPSAPKMLLVLHALFLGAVLLSVFQAPSELRPESCKGFLKWLKFAGVFFMTFDIFGRADKFRRLVFAFLLSVSLLTLNGLWQMITGVDLVKGYSVDIPGRLTRMRSSLGSPNGLAAFYLFSIPISFYAWFSEKSWSPKAFFFFAVLAGSSLGLTLTLSRAAMLALALALTLYFLFRKNWKTLIALFIAGSLFLASSSTMRENFLRSMNAQDETISERLSFWKTSWAMVKEKPFLGHGSNTYYNLFPKYAPKNETYRGYAHNCYLQLWCETGIAGLSLFFLLLGVIFFGYFQSVKNGAASSLFIGSSAFLIQAGLDTHFYSLQMSYLFWTFWGILAGQILIKKQNAEGY